MKKKISKTNKNEILARAMLKEEFKKYEIVTLPFLKKELAILKGEILTEVRSIFHETVNNIMENAKVYYTKEIERSMGALREGFRDDLRVYADEFTNMREKVNDHENRVLSLEVKI